MKKLTKKQEEKVELINCVSWLCLDAGWMFGLQVLCYSLIIPTIITGLLLIFYVKHLSLKIINGGIFFWSLMNILWMSSEFTEAKPLLYTAYGCFVIGTLLIAIAVSKSSPENFFIKRFNVLRSMVKPK